MTRLIDAGEIINRSHDVIIGNGTKHRCFDTTLIHEIPTVDAVPVIRCKDCKFAHLTDGVYGNNPEVKYCDIWFPNVSEYMPINYYCASAERKEE